MIHNHAGTEAWKQGVFDAIGAMQDAMGEGNYSQEITDQIFVRLGIDQETLEYEDPSCPECGESNRVRTKVDVDGEEHEAWICQECAYADMIFDEAP